jgi:YD repeat-containing protein
MSVPRCGLGTIAGATHIFCELNSVTPVTPVIGQKNLGDPCDCVAGGQVNEGVGNPVNAATGNKFQAETDFTAAPITGLGLTRYYNSQDTTGSAFGAGWHSTWHRSLNPVSASTAIVTRADGRQDAFTLNAGVWQADPDVTSRLTALVNGGGTQVGWQLVTADDTTETYSLSGQLTSITTRAGLTTRLTYNAANQLVAVTGPFGDTLTFVNDAMGRVAQMTTPDGGVYRYAYDANNNLASVTNPDNSVRQYVYGNPSFPNALTGIIDENGKLFASYPYDAQGRATSSQHAGGADLTTLAYSAGGTSVTDGNGFVASRTDFDGNVTNYTHDARGDETARTEAAGRPQQRTITTTWLPNFHLPSSIAEPGRTTNFGYDGVGNELNKTITAGAQARTWNYTYNGAGQIPYL